MTHHYCNLCGYTYGDTMPAAPRVMLHLAVTHGTNRPILEATK